MLQAVPTYYGTGGAVAHLPTYYTTGGGPPILTMLQVMPTTTYYATGCAYLLCTGALHAELPPRVHPRRHATTPPRHRATAPPHHLVPGEGQAQPATWSHSPLRDEYQVRVHKDIYTAVNSLYRLGMSAGFVCRILVVWRYVSCKLCAFNIMQTPL